MEKDKNKVSLFSKIFALTLLLLFIPIAYATTKQIYKKKQIQQEIAKLQAEAERIDKENILSREKISYLESRDFKEREAKDKLNLKNPDENVVIVKQGVMQKEEAKVEEILPLKEDFVSPEIPNYIKWWKKFF